MSEINIQNTNDFSEITSYLNDSLSTLDSLETELDDIGSGLTGELRTFYEGKAAGVRSDINSIRSAVNNAIGHINSSLSTYYLADGRVLKNLNAIYDYIFSDYTNESGFNDLDGNDNEASLEERMFALRNYIDGLTAIYSDVHKQYTDLYGEGVPFDREKVNEMVHLFEALGAFDKMDPAGNYTNSSMLFLKHDELGRPSSSFKVDGEYQYLNPDVWNYFLDYNNQNGAIDKLKLYINDGKSWNESGLEALYGDNLRYKWMAYGDDESDAELIFLNRYFAKEKNGEFSDPYHQHGENNDPREANNYLDFYYYIGKQEIVNKKIEEFESYLEDWEDGDDYQEEISEIISKIPRYVDPKSKEGLEWAINYLKNASVDDLLKYSPDVYRYTANLSNGLTEEREQITEKWIFGGSEYEKDDIYKNSSDIHLFDLDYKNLKENSAYIYNEITDKEQLLKYFKGYIRNQNIFDTYDGITNEKEKCEELRDYDLELSQSIYSLKQAEKILPFNEEKKNPLFKSYLNREYHETDNRLKRLTKDELALYYYLKDNKPSSASKYVDAMQDTINIRTGHEMAAEYVKLLNSGHANADYIRENFGWFLGSIADSEAFIQGMTLSGIDGLSTGVYTFGKGLYNCVFSDGVMDAADYAIMFKNQLMVEKNDYNKNIPDEIRNIYHGNNQLMNRLGTYAIPVVVSALSHNPYAGRALMTASMFGNTLEGTKQQGYSTGEAYLYAGTSAISGLLLQSTLGNIPGIGQDVTSKLVSSEGLNYLKNLVTISATQGSTAMTYSYLDMGLRSFILGEPIDVSDTTEGALENALYAASLSCIMNGGKSLKIKYDNSKTKTVDFKTAGKLLDFMKNAGSDAEIVGIDDDLVTIRTMTGKELTYKFDNIDSNECIMDIKRVNFLNKYPEYQNESTTKIDAMAQFKSMDVYRWYSEFNSNAVKDVSSYASSLIDVTLNDDERLMYDSTNGNYYIAKLGDSLYNTTTANVTEWVDTTKVNVNDFNNSNTVSLLSLDGETPRLMSANTGLWDATKMPLSSDFAKRTAQLKQLNGEELTMSDIMKLGRDTTVKVLGNYELKPDRAYRAMSVNEYLLHEKSGYIDGPPGDVEYEETVVDGKTFNNNAGVDWYLGGASLRYGKVVIETPASKQFFVPAADGGNGMSLDPTVKHFKSSPHDNPVPLSATKIVAGKDLVIDAKFEQAMSEEIDPTISLSGPVNPDIVKLANSKTFQASSVDDQKLMISKITDYEELPYKTKLGLFTDLLTKSAREQGMTLKELGNQSGEGKIDQETIDKAEKLAIEVNDKAKKAEPPITKKLESLEDDDSILTGLAYKFKSLGSLQRKIIFDHNYSKISLEDAAKRIGDSVRYTMLVDEDKYTEKAMETLQTFQDEGYEVLKAANSWHNPYYKGLNTSLKTPDGTVFELQFHTPTSFITKDCDGHLFYEIRRNEYVQASDKDLAKEIQRLQSSQIPIPKNVIGFDFEEELKKLKEGINSSSPSKTTDSVTVEHDNWLKNHIKKMDQEMTKKDDLYLSSQDAIDEQATYLAGRLGISKEETVKLLEKKILDIYDKSDVGIRRSISSLGKVLDVGFKNQHEIEESNNGSYTESRLLFEEYSMGIPADSKPGDHPIYGLLLPSRENEPDSFSSYARFGPGYWYGKGDGSVSETIVILNKDRISDYSTLTIGDSLIYSRKNFTLPNSDVSEKEIGYVQSPTSVKNPHFTGGYEGFDDRIGTVEKLENAKLTDITSDTDTYVEVQIYGQENHGVDIIKEVVFLKKPPIEITKKLDEKGIPYTVLDSEV